jgi:hypothetical protein
LSLWSRVIEGCDNVDSCVRLLEEFFKTLRVDPSLCEEIPLSGDYRKAYAWVEKLIESGVPDGRSRLILYVISRYLINVKRLSMEESERVIDAFLDNSCRNHGNCGKVYRSWIRRVLESVKSGGWRPWSMSRIKENDRQLYEIVSRIVGVEG